MLYLKGEGTDKNFELAFYWFQKAANNGETSAQYNLGLCYEFGFGVRKNKAKAFEFYKKSSINGNINAKFQLGYCYINGIGTGNDREKGFELYNEAANNNTQIITNEKVNYLDKVCDWYYKSAENNANNAEALYNLGLCYEIGQGVYQNEIRAFEFYKKSAHQGFTDAQYKLGYCYEHGIGVDINKETAFGLYKLAADNGSCDAQEVLQDDIIII
jgi:TPR repeat protein